MNYLFITLIVVILIFLITKTKIEKYKNDDKNSEFEKLKEKIIRKEAETLRQQYEKCCEKPCLARALYLSDKNCEKIRQQSKDDLNKYFELRWRDFEYNNGLYNYLDKNEEDIKKMKTFKNSRNLKKELDKLKPLPFPYTVKPNKSNLSSYR